MTFDIKVNEDFDVGIDHRGDLASVDGRAGFEQAIVLHLTERFTQLINTSTNENLKELARVEAGRVADDMDMIDEVAGFDAAFAPEQPGLLRVTIIYDTGDTSELEVQA